MARINIEDSLFKDIRFDELKMKLGSVDTALGAMVRAWSLAQKWYLKEETCRLIPLSEWKKQRISDFIIEVGLAEVRENGVYVAGSDEQFAWLLQRQLAGKKGGRPPNRNKQEKEKGPDKVPLRAESGSNPLSLSLSLPLSHSLNGSSNSKSSEEDFSRSVNEREEPPPSENKTNSALAFDNQFKFAEWNRFLRKNKLYCHDLGKNLNLLVERFEDLDSMREFLNEAHSRPTVKSLDERQKNNYMRSVLRGEIGLS